MAKTTQPASYVFTHFETSPESTGISSKPYAVILSVLLSNYCLYGYDTAAHLTEETKGADRTGPVAILSSIGIISVFGWAYNLALTFSIRVCSKEMNIQFALEFFICKSIVLIDLSMLCKIYFTWTNIKSYNSNSIGYWLN